MMFMMMKSTGERTMKASATQMPALMNLIAREGGIGDRPILDQTGFSGYFDIADLTFAPLNASPDSSNDAPSLATALGRNSRHQARRHQGPRRSRGHRFNRSSF
jgi:uncharacterized protein (TIGR03435 family)